MEFEMFLKQDVPEYLHTSAAGNVTLHLHKLLREDRVGEQHSARRYCCTMLMTLVNKAVIQLIQPSRFTRVNW